MSVHTVNISEAEGHLAELVKLANQGEKVEIDCNGAIIELVVKEKVPAHKRREFGWYEGQKWHISDDFDDELPDSFWLGEEA